MATKDIPTGPPPSSRSYVTTEQIPSNRRLAKKIGLAANIARQSRGTKQNEKPHPRLSLAQIKFKYAFRELRFYAGPDRTGITQRQMAELLELPASHGKVTIMRWERINYPHLPGIERLRQIQEYLDMKSRGELVELKERKSE